jgi:hypothetical protein
MLRESRLIAPRGHKVLKMMQRNNLKHLSLGEPTYLPFDGNKLPDYLLQRVFIPQNHVLTYL